MESSSDRDQSWRRIARSWGQKNVSLDVFKASHLLCLQYQDHYPPHPRSGNSSSSVGEGVKYLGEREKDKEEF